MAVALPAPALGAIYFEDGVECVPAAEAAARLDDVIAHHPGAEELTVSVVVAPAAAGLGATLRVVSPAGDVIFERRIELVAVDCPSTPELFATMLATFLREFPRERWGAITPAAPAPAAQPQPPPAPEVHVIERDVTGVGIGIYTAVDSRWWPPSADLTVGALVEVGSGGHRFLGSLGLRVALPHDLGEGHFIEGLGLVGVGWSYGGESWRARVQVLTGGLMIAGYGFTTNRTLWLPWVELEGAFMWTLGPIELGPVVGLSPLQHDVVTSGGAAADVPWLRIGVMVVLPLWHEKI